MYLTKYKRDLYRIVESVRIDGKVKNVVLKYVGKLTPREYNHLKSLLVTANKKSLDNIIKEVKELNKNSQEKKDMDFEKVSLQEVKTNVFRKSIDKEWLKKAYLREQMTIGSIAQILGVSKDRVREHLEELGYSAQKRLKVAKAKRANNHVEFGWHLVNGEKIKDPTEFKIIEEMIYWRTEEKLSYDKIAKKLMEKGIVGRLGSKT